MKRIALALWLALFVCTQASAQGGTQPLVVEQMVCRGNASTSCTFILGQVYLAEGDVIDEEELENAKLRLLFLRNFATVSIYLEKGSERGKARVVVEVTEANPITTELAYSLYKRGGGYGQSLVGRATHYNLFGSGKIFDARAVLITPFADPTIEQYFVRAQYIDPHLFDAKRYFYNVGASYLRNRQTLGGGDQTRSEQVSYDLTFGRRLFDFSYVTFGYQYRPVTNISSRKRDQGKFVPVSGTPSNVLVLGYGWNSEDDPYFPTRGSRLELVLAKGKHGEEYSSGLYRRTWKWGETIWTGQYQDEKIFTLQVAHPYVPARFTDDITRGRWYAIGGIEPFGYNRTGDRNWNLALSTGVLFETKRFGIVQLAATYSTDVHK